MKHLMLAARKIVEETGDFLLQELGKVQSGDIEEKGLNSLVSYVDKTAEEKLVSAFQQLLPDSVFLTEEDTIENQQGEWQWIIDPLDGTTNFIHQLPCFSISVALRHFDKTVMGIVYDPSKRECFYAYQGGGAFLNDKAIHVSDTSTLSESLMATGFPYYDFEWLPQYLKTLEYFIQETRGIRRFGSAAIDLAYVAAGRFDAFFEYSLNAWDVAAGAYIVEQAGGKVSDFTGKDNYLFGGEIITSNAKLYDAVADVIKTNFQNG